MKLNGNSEEIKCNTCNFSSANKQHRCLFSLSVLELERWLKGCGRCLLFRKERASLCVCHFSDKSDIKLKNLTARRFFEIPCATQTDNFVSQEKNNIDRVRYKQNVAISTILWLKKTFCLLANLHFDSLRKGNLSVHLLALKYYHCRNQFRNNQNWILASEFSLLMSNRGVESDLRAFDFFLCTYGVAIEDVSNQVEEICKKMFQFKGFWVDDWSQGEGLRVLFICEW